MSINGYLDSEVQKAFLPSVPGVTEHQCKLAAIITAARKSKRSLSVAWLDIANAYGSIHHSLIQFAMSHYHAPPGLCHLLQSWYTGLSGTVSTHEWMTPSVPLEIGVYPGHCSTTARLGSAEGQAIQVKSTVNQGFHWKGRGPEPLHWW